MPEEKKKTGRLYFIDAIRAWAILMMLQGHFIDGLLDPVFRDPTNTVYVIWEYFRGITAPVFFTVSGFIFTYLLIRVPQQGFENPRIKKGVRRGLQLLFIGYLLRLNLFGLFQGKIYEGFYLVDVLHIIGLAILGIIGCYLLTHQLRKWVFPALLFAITLFLFAFEPYYSTFTYSFLPDALANYFTRANGSVFTIVPWFGYTAAGGFLAVIFYRYRQQRNLYTLAIPLTALPGLGLVFFSSPLFAEVYAQTGWEVFYRIQLNNYLFIRLGDVLIAFSVFMVLRQFLMHRTILRIGSNTLSIYVIHFIILYGSFTGLGLYQFFKFSLNPLVAISGALAFMVLCSYLALQYDNYEKDIKTALNQGIQGVFSLVRKVYKNFSGYLKARSNM